MNERIAKVMARSGACSRRDAERLIAEGRVLLNGEPVSTPATFVRNDDQIALDGIPLSSRPQTRLWRYHKPPGLITSHGDPYGRPTVFEALPAELPRVVSVGRLDLNSEGLLLLTTNGELSRFMEHPDQGWHRKYRVRLRGVPSPETIRLLKKGVEVDRVLYRSIQVRLEKSGSNSWVEVTLQEGKNREIRRVFEHFGHPVSRLIRIAYGPFQLGNLPVGATEPVEHKALLNAVGKKCPV